MIRYQTFTVLCPCGICERGLGILTAMTVIAKHKMAALLTDASYDQWLVETLADAEAVLEC